MLRAGLSKFTYPTDFRVGGNGVIIGLYDNRKVFNVASTEVSKPNGLATRLPRLFGAHVTELAFHTLPCGM